MHPEDPARLSVIVPLHRDTPTFRRLLDRYPLHDPRVEVVVVTDGPVDPLPAEVVHVMTGSASDTSPAVKRDAAFAVASGEILAYVDDDAYPRHDYVDRALAAMDDRRVAAVGGPGITPPDSGWRERLGGAVYSSRIGSGPLRYRFVPVEPARDVDDLPAYNFLVRREALAAVGGWRSTFYGGEDTKLCLELVKAGHVLRYDPTIVVYHCRRPVFAAHARQVGNVGRHRGFFVRRYAATSRRPVYFLPAASLLIGVPAAAAALAAVRARPRQVLPVLAAGWAGVSASALRTAGCGAPLFPAALAVHHVVYAVNFLAGLIGTDEIDEWRAGSGVPGGARGEAAPAHPRA